MHTISRAIAAALLATAVVVGGLSGAGLAHATTRYTWQVGLGAESHMWVDANPGNCTVSADYGVAQMRPEANTIDGVVLKPADLHADSSGFAHISWGTSQFAMGKQLMFRFAKGMGCYPKDETLNGPGTNLSLSVPSGYAFVVVSASEGAVSPWFSV
jgi:hypothetical protein